jgi:hypothetical protein
MTFRLLEECIESAIYNYPRRGEVAQILLFASVKIIQLSASLRPWKPMVFYLPGITRLIDYF